MSSRAIELFTLAGLLASHAALGQDAARFLRTGAAKVVLEHVDVIDGTGAPVARDRNVHIENGRIAAITAGKDEAASEGTALFDLHGHTVLPGIVGMHEHLFILSRPGMGPDGKFERPALFQQMTFSAPRLYLANGVTTLRTTGSVETYTDLKLARAIDKGILPGPHMDVSGPYLDGPGNPNLQIPELTGPEDARQTVAYWSDRGVTSFKAYRNITREELRAAAQEAHRRGLKITGHLCSVTYEEAAAAGIDDIEHGFQGNTALDSGKKPDQCSESAGDETLARMVPGGPEAKRLFAALLEHHVAITSTLAGLALSARASQGPVLDRPLVNPAALRALSPAFREGFLFDLDGPRSKDNLAAMLRRDMDLQRAWVDAGGLLLAGADPVGLRGLVPGFGDHLEIELLVEAGFTPVQAIRIATLNGAIYLGRQDRIGSIATGKNADLVVVKGDPARRISDIENVEIVFKDGAGYDTARLLDSAAGHYGEY